MAASSCPGPCATCGGTPAIGEDRPVHPAGAARFGRVSQQGRPGSRVWLARSTDAAKAAQLLYDFNREFDSPTPDPPELAERIRDLMAVGDTQVLLGSL